MFGNEARFAKILFSDFSRALGLGGILLIFKQNAVMNNHEKKYQIQII